MPLEISNILKDSCGWSFSSRGLNSLFCNKFYTALILTIIILILIMNIYPCKKGTPAWITFKLGFYVLMASLAILFIHDGIVYGIHEKSIEGGKTDSFIDGLGSDMNPAFASDATPILPDLTHPNKHTGGDGMTGDNTCCISVGGQSQPEENEELFARFGV